jgi:pyrimidine operon attenuation protein / uracil phosphoribosyltransferase
MEAARPESAKSDPVARAVPEAHQVMGATDVQRAVRRIAHEVIERNHGLEDVVVLGLANGGIWFAEALAVALRAVDGDVAVPLGVLDVSFHRDDIGLRSVRPATVTSIPVDLNGKVVVLVDDVLFTGRTVRAALDALSGFGRPRMVQLAVMVDRGHRELPLRADFVGKNLPTSREEQVSATVEGVVIVKDGF